LNIEELYSGIGGRLVTPAAVLQKKMEGIRAFVFDWDGVFNNGEKHSNTGSSFSEIDSMGCNLLRFSFFLKHQALPATAMISGERNQTSYFFCERENFANCYYKIPHKLKALEDFCTREKLQPAQVAYFFDDVLDLPVAEKCGIRILVDQRVNPLFLKYCLDNKLADYVTSVPGGQFAVRESAELLIGLNGNYDEVIRGRINNTKAYQEYIALKRGVNTDFYTLEHGAITATGKPA
jgi:3-deoxy-D-manno-octulosonate 8-phosphate phosphatase (KDO 8-P phosphatase)